MDIGALTVDVRVNVGTGPFEFETTPLNFQQMREANTERLPLFRNRRGEIAHTEPDGSDWRLSGWACAVLGELGEAANIIKKVERRDFGLDDQYNAEQTVRDALAEELADTQTYLDLLAFRAGIDLGEATRAKFNKVSERIGVDLYI
jgi:NTP pyrophosphatase (non-canonical NTP hydrolase)